MIADSMEASSFGALLKAFRQRRRLTQEHLAAVIGVHRHAIGRWELGDFLPKQKGTVLELAKHLRLNDQETRQFLEASLIAPAPLWSIHMPRNPFFTGREEMLERLHAHLGADQVVARPYTYAVHGLGGVGKTQLALEYAYRYALEYSAVFWISAETTESIISSLLRVTEVLHLPEQRAADQQRIVTAVQQWLTTHSQWLLIWDNLEDLELLQRFLPPARNGAILLTTRAQALGTLARGIHVLPMEQGEGTLFLLRRAKVLDPDVTEEHIDRFAVSLPGEYAAAKELVEVLGGLPLALDQAGAYIDETGCRLADYLCSYGQQRAHFLARRGAPGGDHPRSVAATFRPVWQRVQQEQTTAADLLRVCTFLSADAIPEELFLAERSAAAGSGLASSELDQALALLRACSLVQRHPATRTFSLHRLVQVVLHEEMRESEHAAYQQQAIHLLNVVFPEVLAGMRVEQWEQCERLLPHVLTCAAAIPEHLQNQELAEVLLKAASYLHERSQHQQAERLCQRALCLFEHTLGSQHPQVAFALHRLARLARDQGQYERAEQLFQQALRLLEQALGPEHPRVALALNGLANVYGQQGQYMLAEPLYQRALRIREQALGPEHPEVAESLNTLGILSRELGKYEQAERLYQRALRIREQALGPEHPHVAPLLNNLANLYRELGKYEQAEPLCRRALRLSEQAAGPEHPDAAIPLGTLATLYREQGKYAQAQPLYQRALHLLEQALGPEHPRVAFPLNGLAVIATELGELEAAEAFYERASRIQHRAFGPEHPETARMLADLARLYEQQGRWEQAEPVLRRACTILEARLGQAHPDTVKTVSDYHCLIERARKTTEIRNDEPAEHVELAQSHSRPESTLRNILADERSAAGRQEGDPLTAFLVSCCERHPRAWCRSADLWQAYKRWAEERQEPFPLTRRAFIAQLKAHGCRADRTKTARIWRGIALVNIA